METKELKGIAVSTLQNEGSYNTFGTIPNPFKAAITLQNKGRYNMVKEIKGFFLLHQRTD